MPALALAGMGADVVFTYVRNEAAAQQTQAELDARVQSLTLYLANFLGPRGITVNAVAPGGLDDDFNAPLFAALPSSRGFIGSNTAVGRLGRPIDVAGVIAFLCTPAAAFVNGSVINIDGGYHL